MVKSGFHAGSAAKNPPASAKDTGLISRSRRSPREGNSPVFLPRKVHEQRSLVGYSPWGHKELGTTERLTNTS